MVGLLLMLIVLKAAVVGFSGLMSTYPSVVMVVGHVLMLIAPQVVVMGILIPTVL